MTRRRRLLIPQRRRIFLGCEGESERGYGALISRLLENQRRDIHLHVVLLNPGGGDPLALIEQAGGESSKANARVNPRTGIEPY